MNAKTKRLLLKNAAQFVRLQLAGNVLFWGTFAGSAFFDKVMHWPSLLAVAVASLFANVAFFILDKNWVFSEKTGKKKTSDEIVRFLILMVINYFINIGIIAGLERFFAISSYIGQFIAGLFFTFWSWVSLKFWVFRHARHARHHAITIETRKTNAKRHAKYKRLEAKQKAKRAARVHR